MKNPNFHLISEKHDVEHLNKFANFLLGLFYYAVYRIVTLWRRLSSVRLASEPLSSTTSIVCCLSFCTMSTKLTHMIMIGTKNMLMLRNV